MISMRGDATGDHPDETRLASRCFGPSPDGACPRAGRCPRSPVWGPGWRGARSGDRATRPDLRLRLRLSAGGSAPRGGGGWVGGFRGGGPGGGGWGAPFLVLVCPTPPP